MARRAAPGPRLRNSARVIFTERRRILHLDAGIPMVDLAMSLKRVGYRLAWDREFRALAIIPHY